MERFRTTITPVLTIRQAAQAVVFYQRAFGAEEIYRSTYPDGRIVAELAIDGARFRVADEAPEASTLSPQALNGTTVRINLLVADPTVRERAIAIGAVVIAPIADQSWAAPGTAGDHFGHHWLIDGRWQTRPAIGLGRLTASHGPRPERQGVAVNTVTRDDRCGGLRLPDLGWGRRPKLAGK